MKLPAIVPTPVEIGREALLLLAGALLAAFVMSQWPAGREYIRRAWAPPPAT